jgi:hypothetical protein
MLNQRRDSHSCLKKPQIPNLARACGFTGNNNTLLVSMTFRSEDYNSGSHGGYNFTTSLAGVTYQMVTLPFSTVSQNGNASTFAGASVTPTTLVNWVDTQVSLTVPCSSLAPETAYSLLFTYVSGGDDITMDDIAINTCYLETCSGQGFTCAGSKRYEPCTPGMLVEGPASAF